jgi:N-hydroxyarylamine O-acetyltransferase
MSQAFDLAAYLRKTGVDASGPPTLALLRALHGAHVGVIPFENLDVQMGLPIRLDIESLQQKLVARRRGGYCFEQNTLFLHVLRALGFTAIPCEARVRHGASAVLARTHMLLVVTIDGHDWLCDVGFGSAGLLEPAPLDGEVVQQGVWRFRVTREGPLYVLQAESPEGWADLYVFERAERHPVDFEMANWYTSTWPASRFIVTLTAQRVTPDALYVLRNFTYTEDRDGDAITRTVTRDELVALLAETFNLDVPADARFRAIDS